MYWRGASTGSFNTMNSFRHNHRFKFVQFANVNGSTLAKKSEVGLSETSFCTKDACDAIRKESFSPIKRDSFETNWKYKALFDIEGHSYSTRLKFFLYSNSVILKHTAIYPEFYQDWLIPYEHFIPVRFDYSDLEEKLDMLLAGNETMIAVADKSTDLVMKQLRWEDSACYIYRLLLSYAKLLKYDVKPSTYQEMIDKKP